MAASDKGSKLSHSLADHLYGDGLFQTHEHGPDADHDHDDLDAGPLEENAIWLQDNVWLTSVGIDIGSAGTQVIFSRVHLRRFGEELSSRYYVVARETLYQSPVALTPYLSEELIDADRLGAIIDAAYAAAGLAPQDIDAGVVILTGEALRRRNAEAISAILAEAGGDFVCATAGHHMEALLAAYGSGAAGVSHEAGKRILNIDIGGGTTKLALVERGRVTGTAAIHIGGRLAVFDESGRIVRLDPAGRHIAQEVCLTWRPGERVSPEEKARIADWMADAIIQAARDRPMSPAAARLQLTEPLAECGDIDGVMFSGGVAEFVYEREARDFGDMGRLLGEALRRKLDAGALPWPLLPAGECIRATALGASEHSVQLSGNTIYVSNPRALLPRRNLQVLRPPLDLSGDIDPRQVEHAIRAHFTAFDLEEGKEVALAFRWGGPPAYRRLSAFAAGLVAALPNTITAGRPIYLVLDGDVAQLLGALLREELGVASEILALDGILLWDFEYVDIGRMRMPSHTVPVTVKSLVFDSDPRRAELGTRAAA